MTLDFIVFICVYLLVFLPNYRISVSYLYYMHFHAHLINIDSSHKVMKLMRARTASILAQIMLLTINTVPDT